MRIFFLICLSIFLPFNFAHSSTPKVSKNCIYQAVQEVLELEAEKDESCNKDPELTKMQVTRKRDHDASYILTVRDNCKSEDSVYSVLTEVTKTEKCKITSIPM